MMNICYIAKMGDKLVKGYFDDEDWAIFVYKNKAQIDFQVWKSRHKDLSLESSFGYALDAVEKKYTEAFKTLEVIKPLTV